MIRLGKLTDYAIVVLTQLAKEGGAPRSAHFIAAKTGVPEPTVAKVLKTLAQKNFVESVRGAAGGYKIARAADDISIGEIISALDGPIAIVSCVEDGERDCKAEQLCPVRGKWDRVNGAIRQALEAVKLSEMAAPSCGKPVQKILVRL